MCHLIVDGTVHDPSAALRGHLFILERYKARHAPTSKWGPKLPPHPRPVDLACTLSGEGSASLPHYYPES